MSDFEIALHGMTYYRKKPTLIRAWTVIWPCLEGDLKLRQECDMSDVEITLHGMTYYKKKHSSATSAFYLSRKKKEVDNNKASTNQLHSQGRACGWSIT
jgi:hypothetical protein